MESFVHLHVHSHYSMMRGVSSVEALCRAAAEAGFSSLALTDTNGFYGLVHFLEAARRRHLRPIVGVCLDAQGESAVFLAKTLRGYELLCELISRRHTEDRFSLVSHVPKAPRDLAVLSAAPRLLEALAPRVQCWVEVVPGPAGRRALEISRSMKIPPLATNAVHFACPEDYTLHRLVRAIHLNRTLSTLPAEEVVRPDRWLKSAEETIRHFPHCPEALANTEELARQCHTGWGDFPAVFPRYRDRQEDHFALLAEKCREGISWRYGQTSAAVEERLEEELDLIRSKGYVDYFLVVEDMVRRRPIHCGRGSAAASLVGYLLGITHVDPIRHGLLFGRFLNPHRRDHPDIDVDFPWDERDGLWEELVRFYGSGRLAAVSNHVGFGARAALREVAKVYGVPAAEIQNMTRRMSFRTRPGEMRDRVDTHPEFRGFVPDPPWPEIMQLASRLESLPRHLSVHCGGIVVVPDRVSRYVPVQRSAKGVPVIQWEKDQAERAGLVKIDLLGNRSLAVIRDAIESIRENTGKSLDYALFNPIEDPATVDLLARGATMGVFYVESPAMRQLQRKTRRGDFEHLTLHSSIIRPAANRYIREYIRRLHGAPYEPLHPRIEGLLAENYGILAYQEDVVQVARVLAGFDWALADGLRKVLSKKSPEQISAYRERFYEGCARENIGRDVVDAVWEMIISFAGYSFCKPHSASYALVSFKSAYLKAHYPAEFMAGVLSNGGGYYSTRAYISEARRMGLAVLGPDVNESRWAYRGKERVIRMGLQQLKGVRREALEKILDERERNGLFCSLEDFLRRTDPDPAVGAVLARSGALDALARGTLRRFEEAFGAHPDSVPPVGTEIRKTRINPDSGFRGSDVAPFSGTFPTRPQILWVLEAKLRGRSSGSSVGVSRGNLSIPRRSFTGGVPPLPEYTPEQRWEQEKETLGFVLSVHPLALFESAVKRLPFPVVAAADLEKNVGRDVWVLGWPVTRKEVLTREGESMEFVSLEDRTAIYETVFFPDAFRRFCRDLDYERAYVLYGRVESEFGAASITVRKLRRLSLPGL